MPTLIVKCHMQSVAPIPPVPYVEPYYGVGPERARQVDFTVEEDLALVLLTTLRRHRILRRHRNS